MTENPDATLTIPYTRQFIAGIAAVMPHVATKGTYPQSLTGVRIDQRYIVATDRYTAARWEHTTLEESIERHGEEGPADPDAAVIIPGHVATWLSKPSTLDRLVLDLVLTATSATLLYADGSVNASQTFESMASMNFPPVGRLIPERTDQPSDVGPVLLDGDVYVKIGKSAAAVNRQPHWKREVVRLQFADSDANRDPVMATIDRLTILAQPSRSQS